MRAARAILLLCLAAAGLAAPACGKKGPPLAPLARVPGRPADMAVRRTGDVVAITFTIPSANIDETKPADIAKVDVFAYTAMGPWDVLDVRRMTRVAAVPVRKPPEPVNEEDEKKGKTEKPENKIAPPRPPEPGEEQGAVVTVTETLTPEMTTPLGPDKKPVVRAEAEPPSWFDTPRVLPLVGPLPQPEPRRFYVAFGVSRAGNRGGASQRPALSFTSPPAAPAEPQLEVTEPGVVVKWAIPDRARLPFQEPAASDVLPATFKGMPSAPPLAYVVYLVPRVQPAAGQEAAATPVTKGPVKLTEKPVTTLSWTDAASGFGAERCYDVRTVQVEEAATVESAPSPVACVTPMDVFPPASPTSLAAVAGEGVISLIWKGVDAPDLAGYIVMRGEAPAGELKPIFETPLRESTYRDATTKPGVRYVYAVVALDRSVPPNQSPLSNKVEETAR